MQITGRAGVPANATAAVVNLTALDSTTAGFVTAYPCGSALPNVSNLNYVPGGTAIANAATIPIGTGGKICLYTSSATNLIADINGWYPAGSDFTPTTPTRLLDTRPNRAGTGAVTELQITGRAGVPTNATAAVVNLTALDSTTAGFVTAYPCGSALPNVSNLNYVPGGTAIANAATIPIGTGGKICLYTSSATNLIADINGWYPAGSDFTPTTPTRLLDTRTVAAAPAGPSATGPTPSGQFVETFDGNTGLDRFDHGVWHRDPYLVANTQWNGDHDLNCGSPDTQRVVRRSVPAESFYLCRDHMMTAVGDTSGYSIGWFSPRQTFTNTTTVSWDVNVTDLGARQWWEVALVPVEPRDPAVDDSRSISARSIELALTGPSAPCPSSPDGFRRRGQRTVTSRGATRPRRRQGLSIRPTWRPSCGRMGARSGGLRVQGHPPAPSPITDNRQRNGHRGAARAFGRPYNGRRARSHPADSHVVFKDHNYTPDKDGVPGRPHLALGQHHRQVAGRGKP